MLTNKKIFSGQYKQATRNASMAAFMAVLTLLLSIGLWFQVGGVAAADVPPSVPASGGLGTVFTLKGNGFTAGEHVNLSTLDPSNNTLSAGYIIADSNGNITLKVYTSDPDGLAATAGGNYSHLVTDYDSNNNILDQYLQIILFKPSVGNWAVNAAGSSSNNNQNYTFTVSQPTTSTGTVTPAAGNIGTTFTLKGSGFNAGEKVNLTSTDPNNSKLGASYIIADNSGNIIVKAYTADPDGLAAAAGGNYATLGTDYDDNNNVVDQYLKLILFKPIVGNWTISGTGANSNNTQDFSFTIAASGVATGPGSTPSSGAAAPGTSNPSAGSLGTVFTLKASGFIPGEKVVLWTTDPTSKARDASYVLADNGGNIVIKVNSSDPNGLAAAAGGNYATIITDYDTNGNVLDQYLSLTLYNASAGDWHLTANGVTDNVAQVFNFSITQ
jgi:hypothetical protein